MNLRDQWTGRVDDPQVAILRVIPFTGCHSVGTEDHALSCGHLVQILDEYGAFFLERLEHETVVDDLVAHVEGTTIGPQRAAHGLDRTVHARTKAARLGKD